MYNIITVKDRRKPKPEVNGRGKLKAGAEKYIGGTNMSTMDLLAKVRSLKELEALISDAQAELDSIKDELKAEMTNRNTEELDVDVFKIRYKTVKSNRFDTTAFKNTHNELYDQYVKQTESRRFTVA